MDWLLVVRAIVLAIAIMHTPKILWRFRYKEEISSSYVVIFGTCWAAFLALMGWLG